MTTSVSGVVFYTSVILEDIHFTQPKKTSQWIFKSLLTYQHQPLLVQGPKMILGTEMQKNQGCYYVDLAVEPRSTKFLRWINDVDSLVIAEIFNDPTSWYPGCETVPLTQVEQEYVPSLKISTIYKDRQSFKLRVPVETVEFYDQENCHVPPHLIKEGYPIIPLFQISSVCRETSSRIWIEWTLLQLKVNLPLVVFQSCQLVDVEDEESEGEAIPEVDED